MSELNPNHPATIRVREQWHKIAALLERHPRNKDWVRVKDESEAAHGG